jgi:hypothetical protein
MYSIRKAQVTGILHIFKMLRVLFIIDVHVSVKNVSYKDVWPNTPCSLAWLVADM